MQPWAGRAAERQPASWPASESLDARGAQAPDAPKLPKRTPRAQLSLRLLAPDARALRRQAMEQWASRA